MIEDLGQVVVEAQTGNKEAFAKLYLVYHPVVTRYLLSRGLELHEAEDLCQTIFLHAFEKLYQIRMPASFGAWLFSVMRNMLVNFLAARKYANELPDDSILSGHSRTSGMYADEERLIGQVVGGLPQLYRDSLRARYWDGDSMNEMSERFGVPLGTIKSRLFGARKKLKEALLKVDGFGDQG